MNKIKDFCLHSVTIAWAYIMALLGLLLDTVISSPDVLVELKAQVSAVLQDHPHIASYTLLGFAVVTFLARMRSLVK